MPGTRRHALFCLLAAAVLAATPVAAQTVTLELATDAPEGGLASKVLHAAAAEVADRSKGRLRLRILGSGQRGTDKAVIAQMVDGGLDGAALSGAGLAEIAKEILVLQVPGLVGDYQLLDLALSKLSKRFEKAFLDRGVVLVALGDSGYRYLFSRNPVRTPADLKGGKPWVASSDPVFASLYRLAGVPATPLPVAELRQNLSTGGVQAFTASPFAAIALSWFESAPYLTNLKLGVELHGFVLAKRSWDLLAEEDRTLLREVLSRLHGVYTERIRAQNSNAVKALKDRGLEVVSPEDAAWTALLERVADDLVGKLYPRELLDDVRAVVRSGK